MASHSPSPSYDLRRQMLETYFDGTARKAWIDLTSGVRVSGIRATVRAGREDMRASLLSWLPADLHGARVLDAGCGTGALSIAAAARGARVTGVDVAGGLVDIAQERAEAACGSDAGPGAAGGSIRWHQGDMLDPALGEFDHTVAMDSLIHYSPADIAAAIAALASRTRRSVIFTHAPHTLLLGAMHRIGRLFPASDRSPAIVPVARRELAERLSRLHDWRIARTVSISRGFYKSHGVELVRR